MGTNMFWGSCLGMATPENNLHQFCWQWGRRGSEKRAGSGGAAIKKIQRLFVAQPAPDPIQRSLARQTRAAGFRGLPRLARQGCNLSMNLPVANFGLCLLR